MAEKHHYFPIFYQKRWAGSDGRVCVYSKPRMQVKALRRHPSRVGFEYDLYTIPGVEYEAASHLERRFFLQTDNDAAQALAHFENEPSRPLEIRLRSGWSRFTMSLIHRAPREVRAFFTAIAAHVEDAEREFERNYASRRLPGDPDTFEEFSLRRPSNPAGRAAAMLIQRVIDSERVGNHLNGMIWMILSPPGSYPLLTSDRPLVMTNGMIQSDSHLILPIGPRKLFVAANQRATIDEIAAIPPNQLTTIVNDRVVKQAREFVLGIDDQQLRFVANRFGAGQASSPTETIRLPSPEEFRNRSVDS